MTTTTATTERLLEAIASAEIGDDLFAPDVTLDATVPGWRFPVKGAAAVRDQFRTWFADPGAFEELRRHAIEAGEVVEFTLVWEEDGVPFAAHQVHVLEFDRASDRIAAVRSWCGGRWNATELAKMEAAARQSGHAG